MVKFNLIFITFKFKRALVNHEAGVSVTTNVRISQNCWLTPEEHPVIATIYRRIADMTGLSMIPSEELQVANYGIGGHYEPHTDFDPRENAFPDYGGDRISTVLFYVSVP